MMKYLLILLCMVSTACTYEAKSIQKLSNLPKFGTFEKIEAPIYKPVVILANSKNEGFCSGTVIDNHYILTAAHCLVDEYGDMETEKIHILNDSGKDTGIVAKAAGVALRSDFGIILGDFSKFMYMAIDPFNHSLLGQGPFVTCGFPYL